MTESPKKKLGSNLKIWVGSIIIVIFASILFFVFSSNQDKTITVLTDPRETRLITLPDQTTVKLNGNSKLVYSKIWTKNKKREVWLEGEGFFNIKYKNRPDLNLPNKDFIVHANNVNIEILGPAVNINLKRGNIKITSIGGQAKLTIRNSPSVFIQQGEIAELMKGNDSVIRKKIDTEYISYWNNDNIQFKNVTLKDFFDYIEDIYGYHIIVVDKSILENRISCELSNNDKKFFDFIRQVLNLSIEKTKNNELIIRLKTKP